MVDEFIKAVVVDSNPKGQDLTISPGNAKKELPKYWDKDIINDKLSQIKDHKHQMYLTFLWRTGLRVTESINIQKKDLDFENDTVNIKWLKSRKYQRRVVPLHPEIKELIKLYVASLKSEDYIFPFSRQNADIIVKKHMGGGSAHTFRHSFAVNWLRCGADIVILSRVLGHNKLQTTMEYLKIVPVDQGKEMLKVNFK